MQFYRRPVFYFALFAVVALVTPLASAEESTGGFFSDAVDSIQEGWKKLTNSEPAKKAAEIGHDLQEKAGDTWDNVKNSKAVDKIQEGLGDLKDKVSDFSDKAQEKTKDLFEKATS